jgi:CBS domain-containing protein
MLVNSLMTPNPSFCRTDESLQVAARLMWECDCGIVPVVDEHHRVVAVVTDRDVCMAAMTQGRPLWTIPVGLAMSKNVVTCHAHDDAGAAEIIMREAQVRRLPVVDLEGHLVGMLSLNDLAREAVHDRGRDDAPKIDDLATTLAAIAAPRTRPAQPAGR